MFRNGFFSGLPMSQLKSLSGRTASPNLVPLSILRNPHLCAFWEIMAQERQRSCSDLNTNMRNLMLLERPNLNHCLFNLKTFIGAERWSRFSLSHLLETWTHPSH